MGSAVLGPLGLQMLFGFLIWVIWECSSSGASFTGVSGTDSVSGDHQGYPSLGSSSVWSSSRGKILAVGSSGGIVVSALKSRRWSSGCISLGSSSPTVGDRFSLKIWIKTVLKVSQSHRLIQYWILQPALRESWSVYCSFAPSLNRWSWRFFQFLPQGKWPWCNPRRQCSTWQGWLPRWGSNVEGRTFFSLCIGSLQHLFLFSGSIAEGLSFILGQARFILLTDWLTASFDSSLKLP